MEATSAVGGAQALATTFERSLMADARRQRGAVYTPPDVVRFMVREALTARVSAALGLGRREARAALDGDLSAIGDDSARRLARLMAGLRILDPAAGAGLILLGAAHEVASVARRLRHAGIAGIGALTSPRIVLERCCHGYEIDPESATIAARVLELGTRDADELARGRSGPATAGLVATRDALADGLGDPSAPLGWDIVVMNPPYVGGKLVRERLGDRLRDELRARDGFAGDLLSHFLLSGLGALRPGGALSAIVSDTTLTMQSALPVRAALLDEVSLRSIAWCRPFRRVAVRGGIVTATRLPPAEDAVVDAYVADGRRSLDHAKPRPISLATLRRLPNRPLFRPSPAASRAIEIWDAVEDLPHVWESVGRTPTAHHPATTGSWTLLGLAVDAGQGLATGDDRRFLGLLADTEAGQRALLRQHRILDALRNDGARQREWRTAKRLLARGERLDDVLLALLDLRDRGEMVDLPERKPFRLVDRDDLRTTPLSDAERKYGIASGRTWIPYETSERASHAGAGRWVRASSVAIDWSVEAVTLLRQRRIQGPRRPVLRHEELWFTAGVTHNRVASYLCARLLPAHAIFSSESPLYVPRAPWLDRWSLVALLNSPVVEFVLKTFLATRNHIELGHVRRLPIPVLDRAAREALADLARGAIDATGSGDITALTDAEREIDLLTRRLYGIRVNQRLDVAR